jgi:hypothetical protein
MMDQDAGDERFRWSSFPNDPASSGLSETETFKTLAVIYDAVMSNGPANLQATSSLVLNPDCAPYSQRTHQTRPDAYMILDKSSVKGDKLEGDHYWEDLAVTMEFKKSNSGSDRSDVGRSQHPNQTASTD